MGVYARPNSPYWWMKVSRPGQKPLYASTGVLVEGSTKWLRDQQRQTAEEIYATQVMNLARGRFGLPTDRPAITFSEFAAWYRQHKVPQHRGQERDLEMLDRLESFFGHDDLTTVTRARVDEYLTKRTQVDKKKASTGNREIDLLKSMLVAAVPEYLPSSPIAGMKRLRTTKIKKRFLSAEEEDRLLEALNPADRAIFLCSLDTLLRLHDVLDLRRDEDHGTYVELDTKTGMHRVPVSTRLRTALDAIPADKRHPDYFFWWRRRAKTQRDQRGVMRKVLATACAAAKIPYGRAIAGITWHTGTRASGATRMLRKGVDPKTVQEIGHWASLEQMGEYLTTTNDLTQAAVNLIDPHAVTRVSPHRVPQGHPEPWPRVPPLPPEPRLRVPSSVTLVYSA
jgi:integrase